MIRNPSETLKILFEITQDVIDLDIQRAETDVASIAREIKSLLALPLTVRTPETDARLAHLEMVQARGLCSRDAVAPEVKTFYAAFGAEHVAEDAEMVAGDKDTCAQLSSKMEAIRRREGLADDDFWARGKGPQDYQQLDNKFSRILNSVGDTVIIFVMRRYQMNEQADLFERNREEFEIQREIGRRALAPINEDVEDAEQRTDDCFRKEYGAEALQRVVSRVKQLRGERA